MKINLKKCAVIFKKYPIVASTMIFFITFVIFSITYIYDTGDTVIDDHFFHFKYASMLYSHGWDAVENFDWIYLNGISSDESRYQVGLYNYFLIPFTFFVDKMFGVKVMDAFFAGVFFAILYYVMRKIRIRHSIFYLLLIGSTGFFLARTLSGRAYVIAVALIFLEMYFAVEKKYKLLFLITVFHVMWHQSTFFMPLIVTLIAEAARYLNYYKLFYKNIIASIVGICVGMMIYSGFPLNIYNLFSNIVSIQSNSTAAGSSGGTEIYSKDFISNFVLNFEGFFLMALISSIIVIFYYINIRSGKIKKIKFAKNQLVFLYSYSILLIVTISGTLIASGRFFDYYIPTSVILFALVFTLIIDDKKIIIDKKIKKIIFITIYVFVVILCLGALLAMRKTFVRFDHDKIAQAAEWIEEKSQEDDKVYLDNWSYFTPLFFYNDKVKYSMGLEPHDALVYSPELYWKWQNFRKNMFYCEQNYNCKDEAKNFFDKTNNLNENVKKNQYKLNSMKIIRSIGIDFDAKFIVSDNSSFNSAMHYNDEMFIDNFQIKDDDGKIVLEVFQLKKYE